MTLSKGKDALSNYRILISRSRELLNITLKDDTHFTANIFFRVTLVADDPQDSLHIRTLTESVHLTELDALRQAILLTENWFGRGIGIRIVLKYTAI